MSSKRTLANSGARLVITGMGSVSPVGKSLSENWNSLLEGKSGISKIVGFDASESTVQIAGEVKDFNPEPLISVKEQKRMDRFIQLGLVAADEAIRDSGFAETVSADRIGTILSSGIGGLKRIEETQTAYLNSERISPFFIPSVITNLLPGQVSLYFGFKGPNYCISSACASSSHAIGEGMRMLERGDIDVAVVGGAEASVTPLSVGGFASMKALSKRNAEPEKASRPFDMARDGFVIGEGAAVLVVERLEAAQARGAKIYAELVGYGTNSDAYHLTAPSENGEGAAACIRLSLEDAGIAPEKIDYINMHGTSTNAGDVAESRAIENVLGEHASKVNCSSTKSMTGHLLGAAGAFEVMATAMALKDQSIPPTINLENQDENCRLNYTPNKAVKKDMTYALSNSFGFGGTNVTIVLKKI
ncbi:beta-ketoacyl-ACP synthase II [bacterium]|nr:beta-ketoacyl-ACP synthase II [bacterium]